MSTLETLALSAGEVAFFAPPPRPPRRPDRPGEGARGLARLIRVVRREIANAVSQPPSDATPRRSYPY